MPPAQCRISSLRDIAAELEAVGHVTSAGTRYGPPLSPASSEPDRDPHSIGGLLTLANLQSHQSSRF
jgi:hypothetical protein